MKITYFILLVFFATPISAANESTDNIDKVVTFLKLACVTGGERLTVEADGSIGFTLKSLKKSGLDGSVTIRKEEVKGLVDTFSSAASENAESVRECMKPYIGQIVAAWIGPTSKTPKENATSGVESSTSSATEKSGTSSGSSAHSSCAAYAGPEGANSTCASDKGIGISTRASDTVGGNSNIGPEFK